jgi:transposase InsO family protein
VTEGDHPVTPDSIIHDRRAALIAHAAKVGVTEACRTFGVSRQSYYRWVRRAQQYGSASLMPKSRRPPVMPNAMSPEEVSKILAIAVCQPTLGARQLLRHLARIGVRRSASGVQKILRNHHLGHRQDRIAALASITAATTGVVTDAAAEGPFGFCHYSPLPGREVALDSFYVGKLKGVGAIWQLTAIDVCTRWAVVSLIVGDKTAEQAASFVDHVAAELARLDITLTGVTTDNGPEFTGRAFTTHLTEIDIAHHRIPPRSPNHNAVCERFQGTALHEFYRPMFHRARIDRVDDLDHALQHWIDDYNQHRPNHSDYMHGRTPRQVLDQHPLR